MVIQVDFILAVELIIIYFSGNLEFSIIIRIFVALH